MSNCFRRQREEGERKQNEPYSRSIIPVKTTNPKVKAYQNPIHSIEKPSSYPVIAHSPNSYDSVNCSVTRNRYCPYRLSHFRSPSISRDRIQKSPSKYCYRMVESSSTRSITLEIQYNFQTTKKF